MTVPDPAEDLNQLGWALFYATQRSWMVLPLHSWMGGTCSCGRSSCPSPAKHPRLANGLHGASDDGDTLTEWWRRWPSANVGIRTGSVSGIVALDIDSYRGGEDGLADLVETHGELPATLEAVTGGGGRHLVYEHPGPGIDIPNKAGLAPGVDLRGDGGYIVVAPSMHATGGFYNWVNDDARPVPLPEWLVNHKKRPERTGPVNLPVLERGAEHPWVRAAFDGELEDLRKALEGTRNHQLNEAAFNLGQLVPHALSDSEVYNALYATAQSIGLGETEIKATIESGLKAGKNQPRAIPERTLHVVGSTTSPRVLGDEDDHEEAPVLTAAEQFEARLLTLDQIEHRPLPEYLIEGVMVTGSLVGLYGPRGSGKSFLAIDFGAHIAVGQWWQRRKVRQGRVLYVAAEGVGGLPKRVAAWKKLHNIPTVTDMVVHPYAVNLLDGSAAHVLVEVACRQAFTLVIIDTVARSMVQGDENSAKDMGILIESADQVRRQSGATTMLVHHSGKDTAAGMRGSSALEAAVDTVMEVAGDGPTMELFCRKQKDDAEFDPLHLSLRTLDVRMPDGTETTSCAVTGRSLDALDDWVPDTRLSEAKRVVVQLASSTGISGPALRGALEEELSVGRTAGYALLSSLVRDGFIVNRGTERQSFYMLSSESPEED